MNFHASGFDNFMDKWIVSFTNSLIKQVREEMEKYRLYNVVSPLTSYFETLTNVYIRLNRVRFKSENSNTADRQMAISTLCHVLTQIVRLMAPFTPFFCDYLWQTLRKFIDAREESVHFTMLPEPETEFIDTNVERRVAAMRLVIELTRVIRERKEISVRVRIPFAICFRRLSLLPVVIKIQNLIAPSNPNNRLVPTQRTRCGKPRPTILGRRSAVGIVFAVRAQHQNPDHLTRQDRIWCPTEGQS